MGTQLCPAFSQSAFSRTSEERGPGDLAIVENAKEMGEGGELSNLCGLPDGKWLFHKVLSAILASQMAPEQAQAEWYCRVSGAQIKLEGIN